MTQLARELAQVPAERAALAVGLDVQAPALELQPRGVLAVRLPVPDAALAQAHARAEALSAPAVAQEQVA